MEPGTALRYRFGRNWRSYVEKVDDARIRSAKASLLDSLGLPDLEGKRFVDAGCGSGLFSLAARLLGAAVRAFDVDEDSVEAARELRRQYRPDDEAWVIEQGSVLSREYLASLGRFDVVYSWGVLHHTGDMWTALGNVAELVAPTGRLFISIYNDQGGSSRRWRRTKAAYNRSSPPARAGIVAASALRLYVPSIAARVLRGQIGGVKADLAARPRGMSAWHDLLDWVGGYPFEVAKPEEVFAFCRRRGFVLDHLKTCGGGLGCNEFVFRRPADGSP